MINKKEKVEKEKISRVESIKNFLRNPVLLVILCTIFTSTGQILFKFSTNNLSNFYDVITNFPLLAGLVLYGTASLLLVVALRTGDLSLLYPFVALSFVWVNIASIYLFNEHVSFWNWAGIVSIITGVSMIGYGSTK